MASKPRLILYQTEHSSHRFRIAPANALGVFVFLANLASLLFGCFEMLGMYGYVPQWLGAAIFVGSLGFFFYSLIFHTDFSGSGDAS